MSAAVGQYKVKPAGAGGVGGAGGGDGGEGGKGEGGEGGVGPEEQRFAQSFAQAWYAAGSLGQSFMHADIEPPGQPGGDGGAGGDGGLGGDGGFGGLHKRGVGPCTTAPRIFKFLTVYIEELKSPYPHRLPPGTQPCHCEE